MPDPSIDEVSKSDWDNDLTSQERQDIREQVEQLSSTGFAQLSDDRKNEFVLAEGGQAQSESGEGGSVSYAGSGAGEEYLDLTRYGKTALRHVWMDNSISAVRTY